MKIHKYFKFTAVVFGMFVFLPGFEIFHKASDGTIRTVVIDAGHGGNDTGNKGTGRKQKKEKDIALEVSLLVGKYIKENLPDVKVVYTRDRDVFVPLYERTNIANRAKADLFISIHCDAYTSPVAFGATTFVMGMNHSEENMRVAIQENSVIFLEEDYKLRYEGFDPTKPETYIALTLYQNAHLNQSIEFGQMVQNQFRERAKRKDRGVRQQPLYVTSRTSMPAVLIELGFLTNPAEEDFLNTREGQELMASAIYRAVKEYKTTVEARSRKSIPLTPASDVAGKTEPYKRTNPTAGNQTKNTSASSQETATETPSATPSSEPTKNLLETDLGKGVHFRVQIETSSSQKSKGDKVYQIDEGVIEVKEGNLYKYQICCFQSMAEAVSTQNKVRKKGFKDAFVAPYNGSKRISVIEAENLIKSQ
ncbi:MAG: N-acetylmuramoyl-L-alanine amidase [Thermaurantimonas sp.]|uniref:N-acetylmuramoyl-L-alanine amidase family protein n=1 Tax=Thermaurantimonas sp. TaxID=2681568 RepID=UPI00391DDC4B